MWFGSFAAGYRLVQGFRTRQQDRADRWTVRAWKKAADEWRATRRF